MEKITSAVATATSRIFTFKRKSLFDRCLYFTLQETGQECYILRADSITYCKQTLLLAADSKPLLQVQQPSMISANLVFNDLTTSEAVEGDLKKPSYWSFEFKSHFGELELDWSSELESCSIIIKASLHDQLVARIENVSEGILPPHTGKITLDQEPILKAFPQFKERKEVLEGFILSVGATLFTRRYENAHTKCNNSAAS